MLIRWAKEAKNGPHTPASKPSLAPKCQFTMYLPGLLFTPSSSWGRTDQEASRLDELGALSFWFSVASSRPTLFLFARAAHLKRCCLLSSGYRPIETAVLAILE